MPTYTSEMKDLFRGVMFFFLLLLSLPTVWDPEARARFFGKPSTNWLCWTTSAGADRLMPF